ncbi:hypothetical protein EPIR_3371 [Erwinia piriflorinigrans CFBP 5888]|uniref:Uncharacterized protein n=1 Tax=Erwinia piriflorinigrans CFBP 5888 TaxID=1161919 RepID=V5ZCQ3_9GAMM|nr:hypothetical protein EPIR_3371 [Erwinia piriflorinigrans CFBP 5888]
MRAYAQRMSFKRGQVLKMRHKTLDNRLPAKTRHLANLSSVGGTSPQPQFWLSVNLRQQ